MEVFVVLLNKMFQRCVVQGSMFVMVCMVAVILVSCTEKKMEAPPKPEPRPVPELTLPTPDGGERSLSSFKGKTVFVNFWATWCAPCIEEMPLLDAFYRAKKNDGVEVVLINVEESAKTVKEFMSRNGYIFPILLDQKGEAVEKFQVFGLPSTYFVDKGLVIRDIHMGQLTREIIYQRYAELIEKDR